MSKAFTFKHPSEIRRHDLLLGTPTKDELDGMSQMWSEYGGTACLFLSNFGELYARGKSAEKTYAAGWWDGWKRKGETC